MLTCLPILVTPFVSDARGHSPEWSILGPIGVIASATLVVLWRLLRSNCRRRSGWPSGRLTVTYGAHGIAPGGALGQWETRLATPFEGRFSEAEISDLPGPVQRHLRMAIRPGTALATTAAVRMHGSIKIGRWLPFRARQVLNPHVGFIWAARAGGLIAGSDRYLDGVGGMDWKVAGVVTVAHQEGPDVSSSAAGRGGAEGIWIPTALPPRFGTVWSASDETHISVRHTLGATPIEVNYTLDSDESGHWSSMGRSDQQRHLRLASIRW